MHLRHRLGLFALAGLLLCGACSYQAKALPLSPWVDESLPFTISLPENWELVALASDDNTQYRIAPDDYSEGDESFRVYLYFSETQSEARDEILEESSQKLEDWMDDLIDDNYEIYNKSELKIDKKPAVGLDFAKPVDDSYLVGRVVIGTHKTHTIAFVAMADKASWDANVRTFDKIIRSLKIKSD